MVHNKKVAELESILGEEVKTNKEGNQFVDLSTKDGASSIMTPKLNKINELGFEVIAIRGGFDKRLRVWFEYGGEE